MNNTLNGSAPTPNGTNGTAFSQALFTAATELATIEQAVGLMERIQKLPNSEQSRSLLMAVEAIAGLVGKPATMSVSAPPAPPAECPMPSVPPSCPPRKPAPASDKETKNKTTSPAKRSEARTRQRMEKLDILLDQVRKGCESGVPDSLDELRAAFKLLPGTGPNPGRKVVQVDNLMAKMPEGYSTTGQCWKRLHGGDSMPASLRSSMGRAVRLAYTAAYRSDPPPASRYIYDDGRETISFCYPTAWLMENFPFIEAEVLKSRCVKAALGRKTTAADEKPVNRQKRWRDA